MKTLKKIIRANPIAGIKNKNDAKYIKGKVAKAQHIINKKHRPNSSKVLNPSS